MTFYDWGGTASSPIPLRPPEDSGLDTAEIFFVGDTLMWNAGSLKISRQNVWTRAGGTHSLLSAGSDSTSGYGDLGSDGVQMVWNQGTRTDVNNVYPHLSVMTSPYVTSPADLKPRLLRSDILGYSFDTSPWVTGCGYAARSSTIETTPGQHQMGIFVVRLSDGQAWVLPDGQKLSLGWRTPLAVTCDELFALVDVKPSGPASHYFNVARIRLDALGPGIPPR